MKHKIINILFIGFIILVLCMGLVRTLFFPREINYYENRYADKLLPFTMSTAADGTFQDSVEKALADQIFMAHSMKKSYNQINSSFLQKMIELIKTDENGGRYIKLGDKNIFGENYIVYNYGMFENVKEALDERISSYNEVFKKYPQTDFYVYYVEKDTDINFETNEKLGAFEYIKDNLDIQKEKVERFKIDNFEEFKSYFYRTDHHWKAQGSYKGYREVLKLIASSEKNIIPKDEATLPQPFSGSKAQGSSGESFEESFMVYRYDFPKMDIKINGIMAEDYGEQENYKRGGQESSVYSAFYGDDMGEIIFSTGNENKDDILIIGESFDNAILKLIASHFNRTYSIDLRYYEAYMGKEFKFSEYLKEHNINKVLLIGNIDYFVDKNFVPEG